MGPLAFFAYLSYTNYENTIKQEMINGLISIADDKVNRIRTYIVAREKEVGSLAHIPSTVEAMEKINSAFKAGSSEHIAAHQEYMPFFRYYQETHGYYDLFLISPEGDVIFSVKKETDFGSNLKTGAFKDSDSPSLFFSSLISCLRVG